MIRPLRGIALLTALGTGALHVAVLLGVDLPPLVLASALCLVLLVCVPAVYLNPASRPGRESGRRLELRAALAGAPTWLRVTLLLMLPYVVFRALMLSSASVSLLRHASPSWQSFLTIFFCWLAAFALAALR
jgi:hypothetical protein